MSTGKYDRKAKASKEPWRRRYSLIKSRCKTPTSPYVKKGIRCFLSLEDVKTLWFRDKASTMKRPSIDRINHEGHYSFDNCRFLELSENVRRATIGNTVMLGRKHSKETRKKMSITSTGMLHSEETKEKIRRSAIERHRHNRLIKSN